MTLEDYIRDQERKAKSKLDDVKSSAKDTWQDAKERGKNAVDDMRGAVNG